MQDIAETLEQVLGRLDRQGQDIASARLASCIDDVQHSILRLRNARPVRLNS